MQGSAFTKKFKGLLHLLPPWRVFARVPHLQQAACAQAGIVLLADKGAVFFRERYGLALAQRDVADLTFKVRTATGAIYGFVHGMKS